MRRLDYTDSGHLGRIVTMQPKFHIRQARGRNGEMSAFFYLTSDVDIYGWYIEARGHRFSAAFLMLEDFYANGISRLYRSMEDDVYGPWVTDYPPNDNEIRCPLPEPVRHELERIQSMFVEEWLFFENDPHAGLEISAYQDHQMTIHAVNVKCRKLNRMEKNQRGWEYSTPGVDLNIIDYLQKHRRFSEIVTQR